MVWHRLTAWWERTRAVRQRRRAGWRELEALFTSKPKVLEQGRLRPHHAGRVNLLETELDDEGNVTRLLFGIVRHPKPHPLAPRGDEVLELLEYRPQEERLEVAGSSNLSRRGR